MPERINNIENLLNESSLVSKTDAKGKIIFANRKFCDVSGYNEEELKNHTHGILNSGYHNKDFWIDMYKVTVKDKAIWYGLVKNKNKSGEYYWVKTYIQCEFDDKGKVKGFTSVRQDVTNEIKQKEEIDSERHKLINLTEELSDKNKILEEESQGIRDYNLSMEELKAKNKLKLSSLVIVMVPIFLILTLILFLDVEEYKISLISGLFGMLIGGFLTDLLTSKNKE